MKTKWSHEPPKEPGWYWWSRKIYADGRPDAWSNPYPRRVLEGLNGTTDDQRCELFRDDHELWSTTPIDRPTPPTAEELEEM